MLGEQESPTRGLLFPAVLVGIAGLLLGIGIGWLLFQSRGEPSREEIAANLQLAQTQIQDKTTRLEQTQEDLIRKETRIEELVSEVGDSQAALDKLQSELNASLAEVQDLGNQIGKQGKQLASLQTVEADLIVQQTRVTVLDDLVTRLQIDRLILVELRKPLPEGRVAALGYWQILSELAGNSDAALGSKAAQVVAASDDYFDWLETEFASPEEDSTMYYLWGADRYFALMDEFLDAAFLVIINRLAAVAELIVTSKG